MTAHPQHLATELKLRLEQVEGALPLLQDGASIPFIARFRKERTGNLKLEELAALKERLRSEGELEARRAIVLNSIHALDKLDEILRAKIQAAATRAEVEDLYLPFAPRSKRNRAGVARAKGLEQLAELIYKQETTSGGVEALTMPFLSADKGVKELADALTGARDIVAERLAENPEVRGSLRQVLAAEGRLSVLARGKVDLAKSKYATLLNYSEPLAKLTQRKVLAALRGEADKKVTLHIEVPREKMREALIAKAAPRTDSVFAAEYLLALEDALDRHLLPSLQAEVLHGLKQRAENSSAEAVERHLRSLLLQPPLGPKRILAITVQPQLKRKSKGGPEEAAPKPEHAESAEGESNIEAPEQTVEASSEPQPAAPVPAGTGMAVHLAALDPTGVLLEHAQVQLFKDEASTQAAREKLISVLRDRGFETVIIGNGPGGREVERFVRDLLIAQGLNASLCLLVSEAGVAAYAGSGHAKQDFPDLEPAVRGTAYLGQRALDPLSGWIKIDLRSLCNAQFRNEVDPRVLRRIVDETVEVCLATVGVDVNTVDAEVLANVPGVGPELAKAIVAARKASGRFKARTDLLSIPGVDLKVFERIAGFLRIKDGAQPLDRTAIHPERYDLVKKMAASQSLEVPALLGQPDLLAKIDLNAFKSDEVSVESLRDILAELKEPGKDPRGVFVAPQFNPEVREVKDLKAGQVLNGIVTHFAAFGIFIDVGVGQDGLVHISELSRRFVRDPAEIVSLGEALRVKVLSVDAANKRFSLSVKALEPAPEQRQVRRTARSRTVPAPRPAPNEGAAAGAAPGSGAAAGERPGAQAQARRRSNFSGPRRGPPGGRRPAPAAGNAAGAPGSGVAVGAGAPAHAPGSAPAANAAGRGGRGGRGGGRGGRPERVPEGKAGPKLSSSGKPLPDYSKFFVKGKRKDDKKKSQPRDMGASRQEVQQIMRAQPKSAPTLGDLLKKAGVEPGDEKE